VYQILIADDDVEILEYLSELIPWEKHNMEICARARNGTEALEVFKTRPVDILITDITMPGMNGLSLIEKAKEYQHGFKSLIITCHEEFSYAKKAVDLGVCGYLVKYTLEESALLNALLVIIDDMKEELEKNRHFAKIQMEIEKSKVPLVEKSLNDLLQGKSVSGLAYERVSECFYTAGKQTRTVFIFLRDWEVEKQSLPIPEKQIMLYAVQNITAELLEPYPVSFPYCCQYDNLAAFLYGPMDEKQIYDVFENIAEQVYKFLHIELTVVIGSFYASPESFADSLEWARRCRFRHFYPEQSMVVFGVEELEKVDNKTPKPFSIMEILRRDGERELQEELDRIFQAFCQRRSGVAVVKSFYSEFLRSLENVLYQKGITTAWEIREAESWSGYYKLAKEAAAWYFKQIKKGEKNTRDEIGRVMDYIEQNLSEKITCEMMAKMVNMNTTYFSKLFKRETDESFSEYLTRVRIERATILLQHSNMTTEEITEKVGLANMHYFYRMYKKHTGKSPGAVRNRR
jgi:two-component system response regulator YesN